MCKLYSFDPVTVSDISQQRIEKRTTLSESNYVNKEAKHYLTEADFSFLFCHFGNMVRNSD